MNFRRSDSPRQRRNKIRIRRIAKRALPARLASYRRRQYLAALAAKRKRLPRWLQRQMRLDVIAAEKARLAEQLVKPEFV